MNETALGFRGAVTAPHRIASMAGQQVLAEGGNAIEAMIAAAATIAVVYPHMNGIGGDGFWLIHRPGADPVGIFAGGQAAALATPDWYRAQGHDRIIPARGGLAALTVPGTIGGWQTALDLRPTDGRLPLARLLEPAIALAEDGIAVTANQAVCTRDKLPGLADVTGFADHFLIDGRPPVAGARLRQPALAQTLRTLVRQGLRSFYDGPIAQANAAFLQAQGSPLRAVDLATYAAQQVQPLRLRTSHGQLWNMTAPTQGVASLMILGIFDRLGIREPEGFAHLHGLIEATKQAFLLRNSALGDDTYMAEPAQSWLEPDRLAAMAARIDPSSALRWPYDPVEGDTVWMGATDSDGLSVSFIQSVFWEFGSGLTCPETGVFFQNRGAGFSLQRGPNQLAPGKRPFHTLNPAMAQLNDGRVMAYGTMGGEGQPQTQAALFSRHVQFGMDLQRAVTAPRWLLGRTWGDDSTTLKLESRFDAPLIDALAAAGHRVEMVPDFSDLMGHAGAIVRHPSGLIEAASDPRSDGAALAF